MVSQLVSKLLSAQLALSSVQCREFNKSGQCSVCEEWHYHEVMSERTDLMWLQEQDSNHFIY